MFPHMLAITKNAPINIHVHVFVWTMFLIILSTYLEVKLLGHIIVTLCLIF